MLPATRATNGGRRLKNADRRPHTPKLRLHANHSLPATHSPTRPLAHFRSLPTPSPPSPSSAAQTDRQPAARQRQLSPGRVQFLGPLLCHASGPSFITDPVHYRRSLQSLIFIALVRMNKLTSRDKVPRRSQRLRLRRRVSLGVSSVGLSLTLSANASASSRRRRPESRSDPRIATPRCRCRCRCCCWSPPSTSAAAVCCRVPSRVCGRRGVIEGGSGSRRLATCDDDSGGRGRGPRLAAAAAAAVGVAAAGAAPAPAATPAHPGYLLAEASSPFARDSSSLGPETET